MKSDIKWAKSLAQKIEAEWREDFVLLVTTGNTSAEYRIHLNSCRACQEVVEEALTGTGR